MENRLASGRGLRGLSRDWAYDGRAELVGTACCLTGPAGYWQGAATSSSSNQAGRAEHGELSTRISLSAESVDCRLCVQVVLTPANVSSTEIIDRATPNADICLANGYSASVLSMNVGPGVRVFHATLSRRITLPKEQAA